MADTSWLTSVAGTIANNVADDDKPTVNASLATLTTQLAGATAAKGEQLRNSFIGSLMGRGVQSAAGADSSVLTPLTNSVAQIRALLDAPSFDISQLEAAAEPLRSAANAAWKTVAAAGLTARAVERAEGPLAIAASITGLPGVTAAWAGASNIAKVAVTTSEVAARAGRAADSAWASAQKVVDDLSDAVVGNLNDLSGTLTDTLKGVLTVPGAVTTQVYSGIHDDIKSVFDNILP